MKRTLALILATLAVAGCRPDRSLPTSPSPARPPVTPPSTPSVDSAATPAIPDELLPPASPTGSAQTLPDAAPLQPPVALPAAPAVDAIATLDGITVPRQRVMDLLIESHGLNALLNVIQLELARAEAAKINATITPQDISNELRYTVERMFKDANQKLLDKISDAESRNDAAAVAQLREELRKDNDSMLVQFLTNQHLTRPEFDLLMETNAYLRKVVENATKGSISEENLREAFMIVYGENVRVRHIEVNNLAEASDVQRALAAGIPFEKLAREKSRNAATAALGGELLPFTRETSGLPESFKQVAFTLKTPGEVSAPVEANGTYHILKLVERIAPKAVKFDSVKDSLREQLHDRWVTERMKAYRNELGRKALDSLKIDNPILARQYSDRLAKRGDELKERDQIARELDRQRSEDAQRAATRPSVPQPAGPALPRLSATPQPPATQRAAAPASTNADVQPAVTRAVVGQNAGGADDGAVRPPATRSGSDTPDQLPTTVPTQP